MNIPSSPKKSQSTFKISLIATIVGSTFYLFIENVIFWIESSINGQQIHSDFTPVLFLIYILCCLLFIPVLLGVLLVKAVLRIQFHHGWLRPIRGVLSGMGIWILGGIAFCFLFILFDPFPQDPLHRPDTILEIVPLLWDEVFLTGIATAGVVGGWIGHILAKDILDG